MFSCRMIKKYIKVLSSSKKSLSARLIDNNYFRFISKAVECSENESI